METNPTVFESASDITIHVDTNGDIELYAPGFMCDVKKQFMSQGICLRSTDEEQVRKGFENKLSYVISDHLNAKPICHFTSRGEAVQLISNIIEARRAAGIVEKKDVVEQPYEPYRKQWSEVLKTCVEAGSVALVVGFLGAGAANIGWNLTEPLGARIAGVPTAAEQYQVDRETDSMQVDRLLDSIPVAMRAAVQARDSLTQRKSVEMATLQQIGQANKESALQAFQSDLEKQRERLEQIAVQNKDESIGPAAAKAISDALQTTVQPEDEARQAVREEIRQHIPPFARLPEHNESAENAAQTAQN